MKQKFKTFLRPAHQRLNTQRSAEFQMRYIVYAIIVILVIGLAYQPVLDFLDRDRLPRDGITKIGKFQVATIDKLDEGAAVTATAAYAQMPDGSLHSATTLAAGYCEWRLEIEEGDVIKVEVDSSTNYYPQLREFRVGDINEGTYENTYYDLGTMEIWGMDASSDAGVVIVTSGVSILFNSTHEEDQLAVDAGVEYEVRVTFDWNAATEEYFGVEDYTQISANKYSYVPVIKVVGSTGVKIEGMAQDNGALNEIYNVDNGDAVTTIWELNPIREDEEIVGDGTSIFTFNFTPDGASGDTLDITFHDETRLDRAQSGATSQAAVETVAQLTTT